MYRNTTAAAAVAWLNTHGLRQPVQISFQICHFLFDGQRQTIDTNCLVTKHVAAFDHSGQFFQLCCCPLHAVRDIRRTFGEFRGRGLPHVSFAIGVIGGAAAAGVVGAGVVGGGGGGGVKRGQYFEEFGSSVDGGGHPAAKCGAAVCCCACVSFPWCGVGFQRWWSFFAIPLLLCPHERH